MGEPWSINALSRELGPDRRTIVKWIERADVKPAGPGSEGPLYKLRDAVGVLSDAGLLGDSSRASSWRLQWGGYMASREIMGRLRLALAKRLPSEMMRPVLEVLVAELFRYIGECEKEMRGKRRWSAEEPSWADMTDAELRERLKALVDVGQFEEGT